jgi:hypothetical protein
MSVSASSISGSTAGSRKQSVFIFEGSDVVVTGNSITAPIALELKQTLSLKIDNLHPQDTVVGGLQPRIESVVATSKGFMLLGDEYIYM